MKMKCTFTVVLTSLGTRRNEFAAGRAYGPELFKDDGGGEGAAQICLADGEPVHDSGERDGWVLSLLILKQLSIRMICY